MSLVSSTAAAELKSTIKKERQQVFLDTKQHIQKEHQQRVFGEHIAFFGLLAVILIFVSVHLRVASLESRFASAYKWWTSEFGYLNDQYPLPQGTSNITVPSAAVSASFPLLAQLGGLAFMASPVTEQQALFLLDMVGSFGHSRKLAAVHFNGSESQLRYKDIEFFLPTSNGSWIKEGGSSHFSPNWDYVWVSFQAATKNGSANPWANTFWRNRTEFTNSPVITDYYSDPPKRGPIEALFRGGLCEVALTAMDDKTTARELITKFVGEEMTEVPLPCTAGQKANSAMQGASLGAGVGSLPAMSASLLVGGPVGGMVGIGIALGCGALWGAHQAMDKKACGYALAPPKQQ